MVVSTRYVPLSDAGQGELFGRSDSVWYHAISWSKPRPYLGFRLKPGHIPRHDPRRPIYGLKILDIYSSVLPTMQRDAAERLAYLIEGDGLDAAGKEMSG